MPYKRPDGAVIEEYVTSSWHFVERGEIVGHNQDPGDGEYTGRFRFRYPDGKYTRWYTQKSAPIWLFRLWVEATTATEV